jgi:hypothetical protein
VWTSGCRSWYLDRNGVNTTLWPGSTAEFLLRTWRFDPSEHRMLRRDQLPAAAPPAARAAGGRA